MEAELDHVEHRLSEVSLANSDPRFSGSDTETLSPLWFAGIYKSIREVEDDSFSISNNVRSVIHFDILEPDDIELPQAKTSKENEKASEVRTVLQEFDLDYSQALALDPKTIISSSDSIVECGITLTDPLVLQTKTTKELAKMYSRLLLQAANKIDITLFNR